MSFQKTNITTSKAEIKLESLLAITKAINRNLAEEDLFRLFEFMLAEQIGIPKFAFCEIAKPAKWPLTYNSSEDIRKINIEKDLLPLTEISSVSDSSQESLRSFQVIIPVYHKKAPLAYVLIGGMQEDSLLEIKKNDLEFIQTISNIISVAIENKRLYRENMQQEILRKELELAKEMQALLFPSILPNDHILELSAYYQPQRPVGGDYYDYIPLGQDEIIICLADVSGKGISAALLMANFQANIRALAVRSNHLDQLVSELNGKVLESAKGEKFITFFIAKYNSVSRELKYVNAGHNPPLLRSNSGIQILDKGCTGLGIVDQLEVIETGIIEIFPDSFLFCYTDGLVEQENEGGKDFGIELLSKILKENTTLSADEFNNLLAEVISSYKGDKPFLDDIAMLSCRFF